MVTTKSSILLGLTLTNLGFRPYLFRLGPEKLNTWFWQSWRSPEVRTHPWVGTSGDRRSSSSRWRAVACAQPPPPGPPPFVKFPLESGCLRRTAAAGAARTTLRADPSPDGKFTVKQVRRVACDEPPPPSPDGTTHPHTHEHSSTKSVLLNPNRRQPNPQIIAFLKISSPMGVPNDCFFENPHGVTPTHTPHYSSTKSVLLNPNHRQPNPPNDSFFGNFVANGCPQ